MPSDKETTRYIAFCPVVSVGTSAAALNLPPPPDGIIKGVIIKAPGAGDDTPNTKSVFLGTRKVTANQVAATGGFPLAPGETLFLPIDATSEVYCIASDTNQKLNILLI